MITFACSCNKSLKINPALAGKKVKCPGCGKVLLAPSGPTADPMVTTSDSDVVSRSQAEDDTLGLAAGKEDTSFLAPPQTKDEIGRLGSYRVLRVLGKGGMGMVLEAEDPQLKRRVALKVMLPQYAADAKAKQRFLREAQAAAALEHDHIISIYQVSGDGVPFLAMPLLKGESLSTRLNREGRLPIAEAIRIAAEIADGLAAAHDAGLIHRDIKPANLWLDGTRRRVKILDFGLARPVDGDDAHLTRSGVILGTPAYMSPEQARGIKVDSRADLFSLGCVLYQMCTGAMPFQGADTFALLTALAVDTPADPHTHNPDVPPELSALILHLLAKKPEDRPRTAGEVHARLSALSDAPFVEAGAPSTGVPLPVEDADSEVASKDTAVMSKSAQETMIEPRPRSSPNRLVLLVTLSLIALIGCGSVPIVLLIQHMMNESGAVTEIPPKEVEIAHGPKEKKEADAKHESEKKGEPKIDPMVEPKPPLPIDKKQPPKTDKPIVPSMDLIFPPDSSIKRITESVVAKSSGTLAFSPDGKRYAGNVSAGLAMFDVLTGDQLETFSVGVGGAVQIEFTDVGRVVVAHDSTRWGAFDLETRKILARLDPEIQQSGKQRTSPLPTWRILGMNARSRQILASEDAGQEKYRYKVSDPWTGRLISVLEREFRSNNPHAEFSPSGRTLVTTSPISVGGGLILWNAETGTALHETTSQKSRQHQFSPDGKYLVALDDHDPTLKQLPYKLRLYDANNLVELRNFEFVGNVRPVGRIAFHPNDRHLAFCVQSRDKPLDRTTEIFVLDLVSGRLVLQLSGHTELVTDLQFCPKGNHLVSICYNENRIWQVSSLSDPMVAKLEPVMHL